jgi:hypothetical protein
VEYFHFAHFPQTLPLFWHERNIGHLTQLVDEAPIPIVVSNRAVYAVIT